MDWIQKVWPGWLSGLLYTGVWWAVAVAWRFDMVWVGWGSVGVFLVVSALGQPTWRSWALAGGIAALGVLSDLGHAYFGMMPPFSGQVALLIAGLWLCFGRLIMAGPFSHLPLWIAPLIGALGGWLNYVGLAKWMAFTPTQSLIWVCVEWAILFPFFVYIGTSKKIGRSKKLGWKKKPSGC